MSKGIVAAGNRHTAQAAADILNDGGNAFDAAIAALFVSFVSEPVLSSPGGGGFLLAKTQTQSPIVLDFFSQTPGHKKPSSELDFHPTTARFSTTDQEFHIGLGSVAVPGMVAGLFDIHRKFARMPMVRLAEAAIELARKGHALDPLQAEIFKVVEPILMATDGSKSVFAGSPRDDAPIAAAETFRAPDLADFLTFLTVEGEKAFYLGDMSRSIAEMCRHGGLLTQADFANYQTVMRQPVDVRFGEVVFSTNPPPSSGGTLVAVSLKLIEKICKSGVPNLPESWFCQLADVMHQTNAIRRESGFSETPSVQGAENLLDNANIARLQTSLLNRATKVGGTTHISVADQAQNLAAVTVSNGEGCGHIVPGAGFMLNNMLGEEDINPQGFFHWQPDTRITSMMAPSYLRWPDGREMVLGSGGSNRIRTALVQTICNAVLFEMSCQDAVSASRLHYEGGILNVEAGFSDDTMTALTGQFPDHKIWPGQDFFFGGVHATEIKDGHLQGAADPRRGGYVIAV